MRRPTSCALLELRRTVRRRATSPCSSAQPRTRAQIRDALDAAGVPAVINGAGSVFATPAAREWLRLLEALERPASPPRARAAALTSFLGWTAERVAAAGEDEWEERPPPPARLGAGAARRGRRVAGRDDHAGRGPARRGCSAVVDGERRLTDLRHVGQLLHAAASTRAARDDGADGWLRRRIAEAARDAGDEERTPPPGVRRRGRPGADDPPQQGARVPDRLPAVPVGADVGRRGADAGRLPRPDAGDQRTLDVGLEGRDYRATATWRIAEERGEDLRLAYVALTRARHQAVVWWAGSWDSRDSPLGRLLFARGRGRATVADRRRAAAERRRGARALPRRSRAARAGLRQRRARRARRPAAGAGAAPRARPPSWPRRVRPRRSTARWRRTSYSDITAGAHEARVGQRARGRRSLDGRARRAAPTRRSRAGAVAAAGATMPGGVRVGTFVHRVLEAADFARDLTPSCRRRARGRAAAARGDRVGGGGRRRAAAALETPLGPLVGVAAARRRARRPARRARLRAAARRRRRAGGRAHAGRDRRAAARAPAAGDPLAGYADRLADPDAARERARLPDRQHRPRRARRARRFAVVDYKTNWLAAPGEPLTPGTTGRRRWRRRCSARTTGCRRCSTRSRCTATCAGGCRGYDPARTSPACSTCSCAG